ncbi:MAG: sigma-70 family RNA polymerase sigma factor, partial [Propionibacteriales bacterium]|nr:sigma-70 family RNA polymerase sigma factor [Propionibacteriales bacterium]
AHRPVTAQAPHPGSTQTGSSQAIPTETGQTATGQTATGQTATRLDETTLVARAQDGDLDSFGQLVDLYSGPLFRLALRMLDDRAQSEDVLQDTFVQVWRRLHLLDQPAAFPKWIYQIATRQTLNVLRTRRRHPDEAIDPIELTRQPTPPTQDDDPSSVVEGQEMASALQHLESELPTDLRLAWVLHTHHQRTYAEIALITGASEPTVRGRIARARKRLAEGMTPWR